MCPHNWTYNLIHGSNYYFIAVYHINILFMKIMKTSILYFNWPFCGMAHKTTSWRQFSSVIYSHNYDCFCTCLSENPPSWRVALILPFRWVASVILECGTWYHHPRRLQCVLSRNLRIFKVATWHYWCRHHLKNNCIWDDLQCCLLFCS